MAASRAHRTGIIVFGLLFLAAMAQLAIYVPDLPARVVTRAVSGDPMELPKAAAAGIFVFIVLGAAGYVALVSVLMAKLPARYFKVLPDSEYWMDPAREKETRGKLASQLVWLGNVSVALFLATYQLIFMANLDQFPVARLETATSLLSTLYLTYVFLAFITLRRQFRIPPSAPKPPSA